MQVDYLQKRCNIQISTYSNLISYMANPRTPHCHLHEFFKLIVF